MRSPSYGSARAEEVYYSPKKKWLFVDFNRDEGMKFAMAVLRGGLGMKNVGNNFHLRITWDGKDQHDVLVQVFGEEK